MKQLTETEASILKNIGQFDAEEYEIVSHEDKYKRQVPIIPDLEPEADNSVVIDGHKFKTKPYDHQLTAFNRFKDSPYFGLFMDMGTGKTKVTIDIAVHKFQKGEIDAVLVIAPNHVHSQWINEQFPIHCPIQYVPFIWISGKQKSRYFGDKLDAFLQDPTPGKMKVLAMNVEAFQSNSVIPYVATYVKNNKCFIVIDEATRIKNSGARRSKTIHRLNKYGTRAILTGTPTAKSPFDLWSQMEFLKENFFNCKFFIFQHRYGVMMKGVNQHTGARYSTLIDEKTFSICKSKLRKLHEARGGKLMQDDFEMVSVMLGISEKNVRFIDGENEYRKYKRLGELKEHISPYVYSIKKSECLDLPEKIYEQRFVDMSPEQKRVYNTLKTQLLVEYESKELSVLNKVALTTRLMQICGGFFPYQEEDRTPQLKMIGTKNPKMEALLEDIEELGDNKVIVWAQFVAELKLINQVLSKDYSCCLYYGGTPQNERARIIEDFKAGKYQIFIGNASTAGFGLNLQNATYQKFFSNSFKTEDRLQAEDRSHRIGVKNACVYTDIVIKGTIDERVAKVIKEGRDLNNFFKSNSLKELLT